MDKQTFALIPRIFAIGSEEEFTKVALDIFRLQAAQNAVYGEFIRLLGKTPASVSRIEEIPFLPIEFFKTHRIITGTRPVELVFESSGTTGQTPSRHYIADKSLYEKSLTAAFHIFLGNPKDFCILALLPSYLDRSHSSLVYMVNHLMQLSAHPKQGFFLYAFDQLHQSLLELEECSQKTLLLGVSFALLDFAEQFPLPLRHTTVMETGGMKGRGKEITRAELHERLMKSFGTDRICSEYGMTELLSQAYALKNGLFRCPPWMRILIRDPYDPASFLPYGKTGAINVIDLTNVYSCSFIQTGDLGKLYPDGTFEVLGRMDTAELRGCNLLAG
ncbi:MAG: acyltransferase [Chitinophagales bacterium]|nr:MAG: acyltransferase [Chitinophagales bacterium]